MLLHIRDLTGHSNTRLYNDTFPIAELQIIDINIDITIQVQILIITIQSFSNIF